MKKSILSLLLITALMMALFSGCSRTFTATMGGDGADEDPDESYWGDHDDWDDWDNEWTEWTQTVIIRPAEEDEQEHLEEHKYYLRHNSGTVVKEPTCEEEGLRIWECPDCGEPIAQQVLEKEHDYQTVECGHRPGEQMLMYRRSVCDLCGDEIYEYYGSLDCHNFWSNGWVEATCQQEGKYVYKCLYCDETFEETFSKRDHRFWDGYCEFCGMEDPNSGSGGGGSGGTGGGSGGGGGSSDPIVSDFTDPTLYDGMGSGKINSVTYQVEGNDLYIIIDITKAGNTHNAMEFELGWTIYGNGYKMIRTGNAQTSKLYGGESETITVVVEDVITSEYSSYKVYIGFPH